MSTKCTYPETEVKTCIRQEEFDGYVWPQEDLRRKFDMEKSGLRNPSKAF